AVDPLAVRRGDVYVFVLQSGVGWRKKEVSPREINEGGLQGPEQGSEGDPDEEGDEEKGIQHAAQHDGQILQAQGVNGYAVCRCRRDGARRRAGTRALQTGPPYDHGARSGRIPALET